MSALRSVVVGMSGGVDSSVAAWMLKRAGHDVRGLFVQSWDSRDETGVCGAEDEWLEVQRVCERLAIRCERQSFVREYWTDVFEPMIASYTAGLTPNPDTECNRRIKFDAMTRCALELGADVLATGHYAQLDTTRGSTPLLMRSPSVCDQTLFLSRVAGAQFARVAFPIGHMTKDQVRDVARLVGLHNAEKRSSTGICFVGKRSFGSFLAEYAHLTPGTFVDIDTGYSLGEHGGAQRFTVGQRARIGGTSKAYYVVDTDAQSGAVMVAGRNHRALQCDSMSIDAMSWIGGHAPSAVEAGRELPLMVQCRHQGELLRCTASLAPATSGSSVVLRFAVPAARVARGQTVAIYDGNVCLGGGLAADRHQ